MHGYLVLSQLSCCGRFLSPTNSAIEVLEGFVISLLIMKTQDFIKSISVLPTSLSNIVLRLLAPNDEDIMIYRNVSKYLLSDQGKTPDILKLQKYVCENLRLCTQHHFNYRIFR